MDSLRTIRFEGPGHVLRLQAEVKNLGIIQLLKVGVSFPGVGLGPSPRDSLHSQILKKTGRWVSIFLHDLLNVEVLEGHVELLAKIDLRNVLHNEVGVEVQDHLELTVAHIRNVHPDVKPLLVGIGVHKLLTSNIEHMKVPLRGLPLIHYKIDFEGVWHLVKVVGTALQEHVFLFKKECRVGDVELGSTQGGQESQSENLYHL